MVNIEFSLQFEKVIRKIKNLALKQHLEKNIKKIIDHPEIGKPLRHHLNGERTVYVSTFRIIYSYNNNTITFHVFDHRDDVYD
jgi:mRNA-degrading endonuclease RelE of RelBE toxin-antitoxin system